MSETPASFFTRAGIYSKEMFPVLIYLPYIIALYACMNFTVQAMHADVIILDNYALLGMGTAFLMMLLMRTFDDLKDIDIDKDLFPERATPRMAVLKSDIQKISLFSFLTVVLINLLFGKPTWIIFFIMITYCVLTFKWFFAEKFHREHVYFTMITHQPIPYVINLFLVFTALASGADFESFTTDHLIILFIFTLPVTAWEVSRKIRGVGMETEYETFSMLLGSRGATWIPFICLLLAGSLSLYMGDKLDLYGSFYIINALLLACMIYFYVRFLIKPVHTFNNLKNVAMVFTSLLFFNLLVHVLLQTPLELNF